MRLASLALPAILCFAGCKSDPPVVNVNTSGGNNVAFNNAYDIDEGSALDFVVSPSTSGAKITAANLPTNATFANNVFSFTPDYTQAGLYNVVFTITAGSTVTTQTVAIRVLNNLHISAPALTVISEGAKSPDLTFPHNEPTGTLVSYSADLSAAPGATFDPVTATLSFTPSFRWLDANPPELAIIVTAQATEPDTGRVDTSTARVLYQIKEATSFSEELVPLFLLPLNSSDPQAVGHPELTNAEGHNCLSCHNGTASSPDGLDFHPASIYMQLVNAPLSVATPQNSDQCASQSANGVLRVTPGDLTKSLWFSKISGTDGAGNAMPLCGVQMPEGLPAYYLTVSNQDAWNACNGDTNCQQALRCADSDTECALNSRYVRKASIWILAGALNN